MYYEYHTAHHLNYGDHDDVLISVNFEEGKLGNDLSNLETDDVNDYRFDVTKRIT